MFKKIYLILAVVAVASMTVVTPTQAETDPNVDFALFHADLVIQEDGELGVLETIGVNFLEERHGIYREIPYLYTQPDGQVVMLDIVPLAVTDALGQTIPFTTTRNNGVLQIKIGDEDVLIDGGYLYNIAYEVGGAFEYTDDYDRLHWNVTGWWGEQIYSSSATVYLPEDVFVIESACTSTAECFTREENEHAQSFQVIDSEFLDIDVRFTPNVIDKNYPEIIRPPAPIDLALQNRLLGHILLQVEEHGEAWYMNPADKLRYYMRDGAVAYEMMRSFGLGITDADLAKIPSVSNPEDMLASSSVCSSNDVANRTRGKILLQVQQHGEAWYVHPDTCRRIYMKDGAAAYSIMRFLSLGISNENLSKLPMGQILDF